MGLSISADCDMAISWRDSFPSRRLSNMLLGSFNVVVLFFSLLGEVDCCYNLMTLHITNHFLGSCSVSIVFRAMMSLRSRSSV